MNKLLKRGDDKFLEACRDPQKRDEMIRSLQRTRFWALLITLFVTAAMGLNWLLIFNQRSPSVQPGLNRSLLVTIFLFVVGVLNATNATTNLRLIRAHWLGREPSTADE